MDAVFSHNGYKSESKNRGGDRRCRSKTLRQVGHQPIVDQRPAGNSKKTYHPEIDRDDFDVVQARNLV